MKRKFAQISGGILGFIADDTRGAVTGYRVAGALYDRRMPVIPSAAYNSNAMEGVVRALDRTRSAQGGVFHGAGDHATKSYYTQPVSRRPKKLGLYKALCAPTHLTANWQIRFAANSGVQTSNLLPYWNGTLGVTTNWILDQLMQDDIESALTLSSPTPNVAQGGALFNTRRYMVQKVTTTHMVKNVTTIPITVWFYDLVPRKDNITANPINDWYDGIANQQITMPGADNGLSGTVIGTTPFQSPIFTANWKVRKVSKIIMGGGVEHIHKVTIRPRYLFSAAASDALQAKVSHGTMIVHHGGIVVNPTGGDPPTAWDVSTSNDALAIVGQTRILARMFERSLSGYAQWNNLTVLPPAAQQTVNEESDTITTVQTL